MSTRPRPAPPHAATPPVPHARSLPLWLTVIAILLSVAPLPAARAQSVAWIHLQPPARYGHAMAFDSGRGRAVLFGGAVGTAYNGETWEWTGSRWARRDTAGPAARYDHAMAYDSARGVTVLFGGTTNLSGATSGETWEWNGSAWAQRAIAGPTPRVAPVMAYDAALASVLLFGGGGDASTFTDETWALGSPCAATCPADADCNGSIEPADVAFAVSIWFASIQNGTLAGDFDGSGSVQPADIALFVARWFNALNLGC